MFCSALVPFCHISEIFDVFTGYRRFSGERHLWFTALQVVIGNRWVLLRHRQVDLVLPKLLCVYATSLFLRGLSLTGTCDRLRLCYLTLHQCIKTN